MFISAEHFFPLADRDAAKTLLQKSLETVEIEIHSYCNRTCACCPNSFIDRRHDKRIMDPALYSKVMDDLAQIDYRGIVWYSRYNEPTSDRPLFLDRLKEARAKLPHARLQTYTNGDYLSAEYIAAMRDAGLDELRIMAYLANEVEPTEANFLNAMVARLNALGLPWKFESRNCVRLDIDGIAVTYNYDDFAKVGTNRGGALATGNIVERQSPCLVSFSDIYIDHNGAMVPCCDIRSDYPGHEAFVLYRLTPENSIFDGFSGAAIAAWRRHLARFGDKKAPCNSCSRRQIGDTPQTRELFDKIAQLVAAVEASSA